MLGAPDLLLENLGQLVRHRPLARVHAKQILLFIVEAPERLLQ